MSNVSMRQQPNQRAENSRNATNGSSLQSENPTLRGVLHVNSCVGDKNETKINPQLDHSVSMLNDKSKPIILIRFLSQVILHHLQP